MTKQDTKKETSFNLKDVMALFAIVGGIISSYYVGQINQNEELTLLKLYVGEVVKDVAINTVNVTTIKEDVKDININIKEQNEKTTELLKLVYRLDDGGS